ncbi:hypothetical protein BV20DRAFT_970863 [Pilatotrama ljubarskyi]|nr:hypothetical protein BV20DRAFT_970863 [Pilatotrama ljubarskyi]
MLRVGPIFGTSEALSERINAHEPRRLPQQTALYSPVSEETVPIIMHFKATFVMIAVLIAGVLAAPIPANVPCKRARLENRQEPCCCG